MLTYKLQEDRPNNICSVTIVGQLISIPINPDNKDYQSFKKQIIEQTTELQDVSGNLMDYEEIKTFVATLP